MRATDAAGNVDETPASQLWTIQPGGSPVNCGAAQTMSSVADAWIEQSSPSANKGGDSILKVMSKSGNANLRALVRFDLPTTPTGCVLDTARLRLYSASASGSQRTLQAFRLGGSWTEGGVTWANQPPTTGSAATTISGTGYREWIVATLVQAMYSSGSEQRLPDQGRHRGTGRRAADARAGEGRQRPAARPHVQARLVSEAGTT